MCVGSYTKRYNNVSTPSQSSTSVPVTVINLPEVDVTYEHRRVYEVSSDSTIQRANHTITTTTTSTSNTTTSTTGKANLTHMKIEHIESISLVKLYSATFVMVDSRVSTSSADTTTTSSNNSGFSDKICVIK